ncbi:large exoprotein [Microbacterium ulmi]|uniref:Large exoprotein n=1 Tax=Microbacterium ulmi TaxID=179095 RepID=A0A7Y2LZ80_9MICO|nr:large exoprotein [Microbacterium ulmi]NII68375.1 hypothetical protein [Microbacterium ulmi]NNH03094.1 large exoprotein [Microbacterium ulmi]
MGGQVLGGGVIVLVCVLLWLVYLLPSWASRHRYDAAERNAVRLNQALRILAETSETPEEVRLELNTRTAFVQQRLARRALAERDELARRSLAEREETAKRSLAEREELARRAQAQHDDLERRALQEREAARMEEARRELAAVRALPAARRARARRRARLVTAAVGVAAVALVALGVWTVLQTGAQTLLWAGVGLAIASGLLLRRMSTVDARAAVHTIAATEAERVPAIVQDVVLPADERTWAPRRLPRPLTTSAGSQASATLDAAAAREALRQAVLDEAMRERAEAQRPPSLVAARRARETAASAAFDGTGAADDAEIEAHVRRLLERRAAGQ